jgi:hypothetical protein
MTHDRETVPMMLFDVLVRVDKFDRYDFEVRLFTHRRAISISG